MPYFKITHYYEVKFDDNDMKILYQKLYDCPFRTYAYSKKNLKSIRKILGSNITTIRRIPLKFLRVETEGLHPYPIKGLRGGD